MDNRSISREPFSRQEEEHADFQQRPTSPTRTRSGSRTPRSRYSKSPSMDHNDNDADDRGSRGRSPLRNEGNRSRSRSRTRSRSRSRSDSRGQSWSRSGSGRSSRSPSHGSRSTKIVVERLTKNINEDHLREIFGEFGRIDDLDLPVNRQFGTNRGTAYILYYSEADAESAIAHMHEATLDGAMINVSIVLPRRKMSPPPPTGRYQGTFEPGPRQGPRAGPFGGPAGDFGPRRRGGRGSRFASGSGRLGSRSDDHYRPRSGSRSRSRSYSRSPSRSPPPTRNGRSGRDSHRPRSRSRDSYGSYARPSRSLSRSRERERR